MGNNVSKTNEGSSQEFSDPRSPTPDISRTPILKQDEANIQKITKNVDLTKECFEKYGNEVPLNPAVRLILSEFDPRSPTMEFQRTPLSVLIKDPELMAAYNRTNAAETLNTSIAALNTEQNDEQITDCAKNLENELANLSVNAEDKNNALTINTDCSVETPYIPMENNQTPVLGLLETNLDYIETDLDTVRRKYKNRKPKKDCTPSIKAEDNLQDNISSEDVDIKDIFDHDLIIQQKRTEKAPNHDSLLIYEDNFVKLTPIKKMTNYEGSRTPLASVNNIDKPASITRIIESDKKYHSKIPVKVKKMEAINSPKRGRNTLKKKLAESVENTPPKPRQARWDQDNSVIL